jgi:hypothetical protein
MCIISIPIEKKLNGKSPYEAFYFYYGKDLADKLGCHEAAVSSINLIQLSNKDNIGMSLDKLGAKDVKLITLTPRSVMDIAIFMLGKWSKKLYNGMSTTY